MNKYVAFFAKGLAMGAANVIPGVSGGTIAFITGIYQRLIDALKSFDGNALKLLFKGDFKGLALKTDLAFLASVFLGVAVSILSLAKVLKWAFLYHEIYTLAFFFGLIVASVIGVGREISQYSFVNVSAILLGVAIAGGIAFLPPAASNTSFIYLMICGGVAICSMILPGLSGSYILLLMGNYVITMQAISALDLGILLPIALGCLLGVVLFSRFLSYLFKNYRDLTISILAGFVAGSLAVIWPWKITEYVVLDGGKEKATGYNWFVPDIDSSFFIAVSLALIGFLVVWFMEKWSKAEGKN